MQSEAEQNLSKTIMELCQALESGNAPRGLASTIINKSLHSSPASLEQTLRRFTLTREKNDEIDAPVTDDDGGEAPKLIDPYLAEKGQAIAAQALQKLEAIQIDTKLGALGILIDHLTRTGTSPKRICVLTDYLSTLYYLAAEVEGRNIPCELVHGSMSRDARHDSLSKFQNEGGILLATRAVMSEGLNLGDVTDLVLYDLPRNRMALLQMIGRFDRFGRTSRLNIHVLVPEDGPDDAHLESLSLLHEIEVK